jgi:hypothetical protein
MYFYLLILSNVLVVMGYLPEIYSLVKLREVKASNIWMWGIWMVSSSFGVAYCALNEDYYVMAYFLLHFVFSSVSFVLNYYFRRTEQPRYKSNSTVASSSDFDTFSNIDWSYLSSTYSTN